MKLTNKYNLDPEIAMWLEQDFYDHEGSAGTLTATTTLKSDREIVLFERHNEEIEVDVSDRLFALRGAGIHAVLDKAVTGKKDIEHEVRLKYEIDGAIISGKPDLIRDSMINDYKDTGVYNIIYQNKIDEWRKQLSIYRWLYYKERGKILSGTGKVHAFARDWRKAEARRKADYPKIAQETFIISLLSLEDTEELIKSKIKSLNYARKQKDNDLPLCTDAERWKNSKGEYNKCTDYCVVNKFCNQCNKDLK